MDDFAHQKTMKQALIFSLIVKSQEDTSYYAMLYYALETLYNSGYKGEFDIIAYYASEYNIKEHKHFVGDQDLFRDYPKVTFIQMPFTELKKDVHLFKWACVDHFINNFYNYDKIFILDIDVIFFTNPAPIFVKYSDLFAHILNEGSEETIHKVLGRNGINGGQLLIHKSLFQRIEWYKNISEHKDRLVKRATEILTDKDQLNFFTILSEQYAMMNTLLDYGIKFSSFDTRDVLFGDYACKLYIDNGEVKVVSNTNILHYFGCKAHVFLPVHLLNDVQRRKRYEYIWSKADFKKAGD